MDGSWYSVSINVNLYYKKPMAKKLTSVCPDDVILLKMSSSPLLKFRLYTGMKVNPDFNVQTVHAT